MSLLKNLAFAALLSTFALTSQATIITSPNDAALVGGVVVGFESIPPYAFYSSLTIGDMTILPEFGTITVDNNGSGHFLPTTNYAANFTAGSFTFSFATDVIAFGLLIGDTNWEQTLTAFDGLSNIIEVITIPDQIETFSYPYFGFYGFDAGTARIDHVVLSANFGDVWILDDVTYVVPEPTSIALVGMALAGLTASKRRRSRA